MKTVGEFLKQKRRELSLSPWQAARVTGLSWVAIASHEEDRIFPNYVSFTKYCEGYKLTHLEIEEFLTCLRAHPRPQRWTKAGELVYMIVTPDEYEFPKDWDYDMAALCKRNNVDINDFINGVTRYEDGRINKSRYHLVLLPKDYGGLTDEEEDTLEEKRLRDYYKERSDRLGHI